MIEVERLEGADIGPVDLSQRLVIGLRQRACASPVGPVEQIACCSPPLVAGHHVVVIEVVAGNSAEEVLIGGGKIGAS